jgi:hypothetical protein
VCSVMLLRLFFLVEHISEMLKCCEVRHQFISKVLPFRTCYILFLILLHLHAVCLDGHCKLTKGVGSDVNKSLYMPKPI